MSDQINAVAPNITAATSAAPAGASTPNADAATIGSAPADWTSGLNDDFKGYVQAKGFKDVSMLVDSYRNSESLISKLTGAQTKDRVVALPEKADDARWKDVYAKMGVPAKAEEYKLAVQKDSDPAFVKWAQETFHSLNLTPKQAEQLSVRWNEQIAKQQAAVHQDYEAKAAEQENALKREWGAAYDLNVNIAKRAAQEFGLDGATIDKLEDAFGGYDKVMKFFNQIGAKLGEDSYVNGTGSGFGTALTPQAAQVKINELKQDQGFVTRYLAGDSEAKAEMDRLHKYVIGEI